MGNSGPHLIESLLISVKAGEEVHGGLFDYSLPEAKLRLSRLTITQGGYLNDNNGTLALSTDDEPLVNSILQLSFGDRMDIRIKSLQSLIHKQKVWIGSNNSSVVVKEGDEIKLGRFEFRVKKILFQDEIHPAKSQFFRPSFIEQNIRLDDSKIPQCRICFMSGEEANELISPCLCSGSQGFIHLKCLRDWLATKVDSKEDTLSQVIISQPLKCEICGAFFKTEFNVDDRVVPLLRIKHLPAPYMILEGSKVGDVGVVTVALKMVEGRETTLGREVSNDVVLSEISISRTHCSFLCQNGQVYLNDKQSKFGTLTRPASSVETRSLITLQHNNMVINISEPPTMTSSCWHPHSLTFHFES